MTAIAGCSGPPIRALIQVGLAAISGPDSGRFPARQCGDSGTVRGGFFVFRSAVAGLRFFAVLRTGWRGDTSPPNGSCRDTGGNRAGTTTASAAYSQQARKMGRLQVYAGR